MLADRSKNDRANSKRSHAILLTLLAPVLWGTTYWVTTYLLPPNLPIYTAVIRTLPAGIVIVLLSRQFPRLGQWRSVLILSFLNISFFQAMLFVAAYRLPGGIAAIMGALQPVVILFLYWSLQHKRPSSVTVMAIGASILGMIMLLVTPKAKLDTLGIVASLLGAMSMGAGVYFTKRWQLTVSSLTFTGWQLLFGGLMLLPLAILLEHFPATLTFNHLIGYGYLCVFGTLIAYFLWFRGIEQLPAVAVSVLGTLSPVTAILIGWLFAGEHLSLMQGAGVILVLISMTLVQVVTVEKK